MERRVRVKICGVTNRADAEAAIELGADALGFNLFAGSKRLINVSEARDWIRKLPPYVMRIAVMVNPALAEVVEAQATFDSLQLHGHEEAQFCAELAKVTGRSFVKAVAVRDATSLENAERFGTPHILLDAFSPAAFGGTGQRIDLDLASRFTAEHRHLHVTLSGGLTPENVGDAVRRVRPYAVDVASGVEISSSSRKKDFEKMRAFISAVREA